MKIRLKNQPIFHRLSVWAALAAAVLAVILLAAVVVRGIGTQRTAEAPILAAAVPEGEPVYIDINTADTDKLQLLPGIGPTLAQAIIDTREENGPFSSLDDLNAVKGIGEATCNAIAPYITFSGTVAQQSK